MGPRVGLDGRKISPPPGFDPPDRPARSSVAIPTELPGPLFNIVHGVILMNEDKLSMLLRCNKTGNVRTVEGRGAFA